MRRLSRFAVPAVALILVLAVMEAAAALFWLGFGGERLQYHWRADLEAKPRPAAAAALYAPDDELGWVPRPRSPAFDAQGARRDPYRAAAPARIAAYGDFFVFGADVAADEAFPHALAELLGEAVLNFGVGGYGPDQAVLRLARHLEAGLRPEAVVLGMPSENIARTVTMFWRCYVPTTDPAQIKPMFAPDGAGWRLVTPAEAEPAAPHPADFWCRQNARRPRFGFPFLWLTVDAARYLALDVVRWQDLYADPAAVAALTHALDRFVALAGAYGFRPLFVMIPMPEDLRAADAGRPMTYAGFLAAAQARFGDRLRIVDVGARRLDRPRFHVRPYAGHASAYGNREIARALAAALRR